MNSIDTNILIYAVNSDCAEHVAAMNIYEDMLAKPTKWIISDQVLFEFYRGLRNPKILEHPLDHRQALHQIEFLRKDSGVQHCAYETTFWDDLTKDFSSAPHKAAHIFDRVLAVTLLKNGVTTFYTRNTKDFADFGFKSLINPISR
jgi:toxin-antitoxin system PIN domain toxin